MQHFYYKLDNNCIKDGKPTIIKDGFYKGKLGVHIRKDGIEDPVAIPVMLERDIPWHEQHRFNVLTGTKVAIEFPDGTEEFAVVCDYGTIDGHCIIAIPMSMFTKGVWGTTPRQEFFYHVW